MSSVSEFPQTLQEAIIYFADQDRCHTFAVSLCWPNGVISCPRCNSAKHSFLEGRRIWRCHGCKKQFSLKVGTVFEDSPIGMDKWMTAVWLLVSCKNGISSYELHRGLGVTQKTAWFMLQRIRLILQTGSFELAGGQVEADETFIGGKARNMHADKRAKKIKGTGPSGKAIVFGILERGGRVKAKVVADRRKKTLQAEIKANVMPGSALYTDSLLSYEGLHKDYEHQIIDHAVAYVDGHVHTNGMENFWSLLKRGIKGTYISVEPFHLFRYLDEQAYRFNERKGNDSQRFKKAMGQVAGKRLTYAKVTGKTQELETRPEA